MTQQISSEPSPGQIMPSDSANAPEQHLSSKRES